MIDCHTHTSNSPDARDTVPELCQRAIQLGLDAIAVTEHCEVNKYYERDHYPNLVPNAYDTFNFEKDFKQSMIDNTKAKYDMEGKLNFICGIELGQATHDFKLSEEIISDERLDFVIASMHQLPQHDDFAFINYDNFDIPKLLEANYKEIYKLCKWGKFDILAHLTYTLRYIEGNAGVTVDMSPYDEIIAESFRELIKKGKGIEINTSGLRQKYGFTFPTLKYVKLFKDIGGEVLSLGSDSHTTMDLAKGIKEGQEIAKEAGFERVCIFKNRQPVFLNIR